MPAHHGYTPDYWVGNLAVTMAIASSMSNPQPVLKSALREFLQHQPPASPLKALVREQMERKP